MNNVVAADVAREFRMASQVHLALFLHRFSRTGGTGLLTNSRFDDFELYGPPAGRQSSDTHIKAKQSKPKAQTPTSKPQSSDTHIKVKKKSQDTHLLKEKPKHTCIKNQKHEVFQGR